MKFSLKKIYSKLYGLDVEVLGKAGKFKATFRWVMVGYAFAQNAIDTIFLKNLGPEFLPISYLYMPIFIIIMSSIFSIFSSRLNKRKLLIYFLYISSIFYIILRASLYTQLPQTHKLITIIAYIFTETFNTFFLIFFYTTINEEMTSKERKKSIPFILMGGIAAIGTTNFAIIIFTKYIFVNVVDYLIIASLFNLLAIYYITRIPKSNLKGFINESKFFTLSSKKLKKEIQDISSIKSSYVRKLIFTMFLSFTLLVLVDFQFKFNLAKNKVTEKDLSEFLALFRGVTHYIMIIFQTYLFSRIIPKFGTINIFSIYPFTMLVNGIILFFTKGFYASLFTKLFQDVFKKMFEDPAVQFAYNPIPYIKKGHIISFIEGTLKHFTIFFVGFLLVYSKKLGIINPNPEALNSNITIIYYAILIISLLYFVMSFWLKSGYYNAFLQKIKTEKKIFEKYYHLDNNVVIGDEIFEKYDANNEITLYGILKGNKKIEQQKLIELIKEYGKNYAEPFVIYLTQNYELKEIFRLSEHFCFEMKLHFIKYLVDNKKLKKTHKNYFEDIWNNLNRINLELAKEIFIVFNEEKICYKSFKKLVELLLEKPYTIKLIVERMEKIPYNIKYSEQLIFIMNVFKFDEIFDFLMEKIEYLNSKEQYELLLYGIKNKKIKKSYINNFDLKKILTNEKSIITILFNKYLDKKNGKNKYFYLEYLRLKIVDFIYFLIFLNFRKEVAEIMERFKPFSEYLSAEIIAYIEDLAKKAHGFYKNYLRFAIKMLDLSYKKELKKKFDVEIQPQFLMEQIYILNLKTQKENGFMKDIIEKLLLLKNVEIFNEISIFQLETLLPLTKEQHYKKGELIIKEGEKSGNLYIIKKGEAEVIKQVGFLQTSIKKLGPGDWFGELSILTEEEHMASVKALTNLNVIIIPATAFRIFIYNNPDLSFKIFDILVSYIKEKEMKGEIS